MSHITNDKKYKLNDKQQLFCKEYLKDLNLTQSSIRAGYSPKTAYSIGCENLRKPEIQKYIQELMGERSKRLNIDSDSVLLAIRKIAFSNIKDYLMEDKETGYNIRGIKDIDWTAVKNIEFDIVVSKTGIKFVNLKISLFDKHKALYLLAKHLGMFNGNSKKEKISPNIVIRDKTQK